MFCFEERVIGRLEEKPMRFRKVLQVTYITFKYFHAVMTFTDDLYSDSVFADSVTYQKQSEMVYSMFIYGFLCTLITFVLFYTLYGQGG